jgi:hypothetical protein
MIRSPIGDLSDAEPTASATRLTARRRGDVDPHGSPMRTGAGSVCCRGHFTATHAYRVSRRTNRTSVGLCLWHIAENQEATVSHVHATVSPATGRQHRPDWRIVAVDGLSAHAVGHDHDTPISAAVTDHDLPQPVLAERPLRHVQAGMSREGSQRECCRVVEGPRGFLSCALACRTSPGQGLSDPHTWTVQCHIVSQRVGREVCSGGRCGRWQHPFCKHVDM